MDIFTALFALPDAPERDWEAHNHACRRLWAAFSTRQHERTPVRFNTNPRMLLLDPAYNPRGVSYESYFLDPAVMTAGILGWYYWVRHSLPGDHEKGLPDAWRLWFDVENTYDAAWFGSEIKYRDGQVPDTLPVLNDDTKQRLFDGGFPDPMGGEWPRRCLDYYAYWRGLQDRGWEWHGRPLGDPCPPSYVGTDGVLTAAVALRGAAALCEDMLIDPDYVHALFGYLYEALRLRMRVWREHFAIPIPCDNFTLADDAIQLLSLNQYREFVLPWHKKLYDEFGTSAGRTMHLCGNAQRHFGVLRDVCNVSAFDTGFPVDFGALRRDLGPDVLIYGGPPIAMFLTDDPTACVAEVQRICASGVLEGGRFVFQEANNLPPGASLRTCEAFYEAVKTHACFERHA